VATTREEPAQEGQPAVAPSESVAAPQATAQAPARWRPEAAVLRRPGMLIAMALVLVILAVLPFVLTGFWVRVMTTVFMFAALAQSLNIIAGFTGYADFGNIVYFGIGAYATGFLMKSDVPFPVAILCGALLSAVIAGLIGLPVLRLRGHYFAIATIGVMEGTRELVLNMEFLSGGSGMNVPIIRMPPQQFSALIYFIMLSLMLGYTLLVYGLSRSSLGYSLRAIKADEQAAAVMGIDTTRAKTTAWAASAACSAIVGGVYAVWVGFIEPGVVFNVVTGTEYFMMMLLGGPGTVLGPVLGGFLLQLVSVTVWSRFLHGHMAILGIVIVLIVLFLPNGLMNALRQRGMLR
jgi:branched-chain amino acid transport system permease protein